MPERLGERGNGVVNLIFGLVIVLFVGLTITELLPAQQRRSRLLDFIEDQAMTAGRTSAKSIELRVFEKARQLELPIDKKDIKAVKRGDHIRINAKYTETLNFLVYKHEWNIDLDVDRDIYIF